MQIENIENEIYYECNTQSCLGDPFNWAYDKEVSLDDQSLIRFCPFCGKESLTAYGLDKE